MGTSVFEEIRAEEAKHLQLKTTEKIGKNHFFQYLVTQLDIHNIPLDSYSCYFSSYCPYLEAYNIILIDAKTQKFLYEPLAFELFYKDKSDTGTLDIFVTSRFFAVYMDQRFFTSQNTPDAKEEDIKLFVSQTYGKEASNIYHFNEDKLNVLKKKYVKGKTDTDKGFKPLKQSRSFKLFLLFLFFCSSVFISLLFFEYKERSAKYNSPAPLVKTVSFYKKQNRDTLLKSLEIFKYIKDNGIWLKDFELKSNINILTLQHKDKEKLLGFTRNLKPEKVHIESITFDKKSSIYTMDIKIEN